MSRLHRLLAPVVCFLAATAGALGAEVIKLRALPAIYADAAGVGMKTPVGVACGGKSLLVVADTGGGRLLEYTVDGENITPKAAIQLAELPFPIRVQVSQSGDILVLDGKLRRIARVSAAGEFKGYLDFTGVTGAVVPRSFKLDKKDAIYVLDVASDRVLVLDPEGRAQSEIKLPESRGFFSDLAVGGDGSVFLIDSVTPKLVVARKDAPAKDLTGGLAEDMDFPTSLIADEGGRLLVVDQAGGGVVLFGADGSFRGRQSSMGWKEGMLRDPAAICVSGGGLAFVADRGNSRVQVFAVVQ